jgi:hypothetical protein
MNLEQLIDGIAPLRSGTLQNYGIPGLSSSLLENGKVRLFECQRKHQEPIAPHSHRFDFTCLVLSGQVINRLWHEVTSGGDCYAVSALRYHNRPGEYSKFQEGLKCFSYSDAYYNAGCVYSMTSDQIHSIWFERGTKVLFFEGSEVSDSSVMLEPYVDGKIIPTGCTQPWMFQRAEQP